MNNRGFRFDRGGIKFYFSSNNTIYQNNFIRNNPDARFICGNNTWKQNYWNRPRILPKPIFGIGWGEFPWINFDRVPKLIPNKIST